MFTNTHYMSKTHIYNIIMVFHRARRKMYHEDIILNNNILQHVHCTIFLEIFIDDKLKNGAIILLIYKLNSQRYRHLIKGEQGVKIHVLLQL